MTHNKEKNKAIIRHYIDELNRRNLAILDELVAEEVILGSLLRNETAVSGRETMRQGILRRLAAFPDYHVTIKELIAEADQVVLYWANRGTHRGEFLGVPATGKVIEEVAVSIYRLAGGRIVEIRGIYDQVDTWQQLGLLPPTEAATPGVGSTSAATPGVGSTSAATPIPLNPPASVKPPCGTGGSGSTSQILP
jgi:steroid delta-isomerase-like uncharacterized protein